MIRTCIVDVRTSLVENVVEYETTPSNPPPGFDDNFIAVAHATAEQGWRWGGGDAFTDLDPPLPPDPPSSFVAHTLIDALTVSDLETIEGATAASPPLRLLWVRLRARGTAPVETGSDAFRQGWAGLTASLGQQRAAELAAALGIA